MKAIENAVDDDDGGRRLDSVERPDRRLLDGETPGQALARTAKTSRNARAGYAIASMKARGMKDFTVLRGRRLAFTDYEDLVNSIGDSSVACMCLYIDTDKMLAVLDEINTDLVTKVQNLVEDGDDESNQLAVAAKGVEVFRAGVDDWFFSYYGICGGKSDGCLKVQIDVFSLIGRLEEHALDKGILVKANVLAQAPDPKLEVWLATIPECYCAESISYASIVDEAVLSQIYPNHTKSKAFESIDSPSGAVSAVMTISGMCLSDECKQMLLDGFMTFTGIMMGTTSDETCKADEVAKCIPDATVAGCPNAPAQSDWGGSLVPEKKIPDDDWKPVYWTVCAVSKSCPALGVSAYRLKTRVTLSSADDADTPEELTALSNNFVDAINKGTTLVRYDQCTATLVTSRRRQLADSATVEFEIETQSEQGKLAAKSYVEATGSDTTQIATDLGVPVDAAYTALAVETLVYPPPPPAPGYKENLAGGASFCGLDSDAACIGAIVGGVIGLLLCCILLLGIMFFVKMNNKNKGGEKGQQQQQMSKSTASVETLQGNNQGV
jgi:hypothetical protein